MREKGKEWKTLSDVKERKKKFYKERKTELMKEKEKKKERQNTKEEKGKNGQKRPAIWRSFYGSSVGVAVCRSKLIKLQTRVL